MIWSIVIDFKLGNTYFSQIQSVTELDFLKSNLEHNKASWQWDLLLWSFFVLENFKGRRKFSSTFWTWNQWGFQIQVRIRSTYVTMGINAREKSTILSQKGNTFEHTVFWDTTIYFFLKWSHPRARTCLHIQFSRHHFTLF